MVVISLSLVFSLLASVIITVHIFWKLLLHHRNKIKKKLPPGEMGLAWIGETIDFLKAQRKNRLFDDFFQPRITKHGKIFKTRLLGSPTVVVNGAEANRFILSNEFKLVVSSWPSASVQLMGENSIMQKQGDQHRRLRGIIGTTLSNAGLEALVPRMCRTVEQHLKKYWNTGDDDGDDCKVIRLHHTAKVMTFRIVFECLLGIKVEEDGGLLSMFERVLEGVFCPAIQFPGSRFSRAKKARNEIEKMLVKVVRDKRKAMMESSTSSSSGSNNNSKEEGMLFSRLVGAMIRGDITEEEVIDNIVLLVFAAHDTTSYAIAMTFKMLAQHPHCYSLLLQEHVKIKRAGENENLTMEDIKKMKYTWQVARESMRLFPPIFGSFRKAIADIQYQGFTIPKGWKVLWTTYGTHYNEEYFKEAQSFNPSRFEEAANNNNNNIPAFVYVPFGGGPRVCAGYQLAKLNIIIFLHYVVTRYDWSLLYPDEPITMDPLPFPSLGMPIRVSPKL